MPSYTGTLEARKRILALVREPDLDRTLERLFRRERFDLHRVPSVGGALLLTGNRRYDLILLEAPVAGPGLQRILIQLRGLDSPCVSTPVVVLAPADHVEALGRALERDLVTAVPVETARRDLPRAVSWVLGVAKRAARHILVQVRTRDARPGAERIVQTENLSTSGMLLRGPGFQPEGTRLDLSFSLPNEPRPIFGTAEIVRHADPAREGITGAAVHFLRLEGDGEERLRDYLERDGAVGAAASPVSGVSGSG